MDMKSLFNDFKLYVDSMNNQEIIESITNAIEHTSNSYILESYITDHESSNSVNLSSENIISFCHSGTSYGFCSPNTIEFDTSFELSERSDLVA